MTGRTFRLATFEKRADVGRSTTGGEGLLLCTPGQEVAFRPIGLAVEKAADIAR